MGMGLFYSELRAENDLRSLCIVCFQIPGAQVLGHRAGTFPIIFLTKGCVNHCSVIASGPLSVGPSTSPLSLCAEVSFRLGELAL